MDEIKNKSTLRNLFAKIYSITILGTTGSIGISFFFKDIWLHLMKVPIILVISIVFISFLRSILRPKNLLSFILCKILDGFFFSTVFFMITYTKLATIGHLYLAIGIGLLFFIVSAICSVFIKKESYNNISFTIRVIFITCIVLSGIDLIMFFAGYHLLFINTIISYATILASSIAISLINKIIVTESNINIWHVSDLLSYYLLSIIDRVFMLLINKNSKKTFKS